MGILLQPFLEMRLICLIPGEKVGIAKMHQGLLCAAEKDGANVLRIGQIDFAESCRDAAALGVERADKLAVHADTRGADRQRIGGGNAI